MDDINLIWNEHSRKELIETPVFKVMETESISPDNQKGNYIVIEAKDWCVLYTAARETLFRSGAMSSRISQLNIIDILYTYWGNLEYDHTLDQLSKTHIHKPG